MRILATACALVCAPTVLAAEKTIRCETADSGDPVIEITEIKGTSSAKVTYLESDPVRALDVSHMYLGFGVIGLDGKYSPFLSTRLEVYRAPGTDDFLGLLWPIGASNAWNVVCKVNAG